MEYYYLHITEVRDAIKHLLSLNEWLHDLFYTIKVERLQDC